ncbi:hypothetical protein QBC39DRAFT_399373 [Podospora conica]|nr:hypothetical protein QBC39DRAFT_399373 [Schizothecium conicum]
MSPSRLPVKGSATSSSGGPERSHTRAASTASVPKSSRPLSGVFGRLRQATTGRARAPTVSSAAPSSTTRSSSRTRAPYEPSQGHSRTKSSVTSLTSATTLRPPSRGSSSTSTTPTTATFPPPADRSRPPITSTTRPGHRRQLSGPTLTSTTSTAPSLAPRRLAHPPPPQPQPHPQLHQQPSLHRPAFNTHQQHYSPAKSLAPKPTTASYLAPPSPSKLPANVAISSETARLQTELLQLHLLHRVAAPVAAQWRASARSQLGARFAALVARDDAVGRLEAEAVEEENVRALLAWGAAGGAGLEGKVQALDAVVCGLWGLLQEPGGRWGKVVRRFERWLGRVEEARGERKRMDGAAAVVGVERVLVGEMDGAWREECGGLARRLSEMRRGLEGLGVEETLAPRRGGEGGQSSLVRMVGACRILVAGMLEELEVMDGIEREVVEEERQWVSEVNREMDKEESTTKGAGAIWRVL